MSSLVIQPDPVITGVVRVSTSTSFPRPWIAVVGSLHGNEPCGLRAMERLKEQAERGALPLKRGTVILVHGNPEATRHNLRHTRDGADLNRLFDFEFEALIRRESWAYEHERAIALRPIFESVDGAIDLHSATEPTPPFVITTSAQGSSDLGRAIGLAHVTRGWEDLNILSGKVFLALLTKRGKPAIAVECGQHHSPEADNTAYKAATRFLIALDVLEGEIVTQTEVELLDVIRALRKPSEDFRFSQRLSGLQLLTEGTVIGSDGDITVSVSEDRYAVLPNDRVHIGGDMLFLARPASAL
ncbi:MAG: succinylglutamate desuccinylase/aspartoacylase family protein [Deltaproteobacteria bacterium]|nr:succinylglutamate desuccinylase/aspartoacylase family protein [Deltaproteobacteria bacterium]